MKLGIIGYGARIGKDVIPEILKLDNNCKVVSVTDINQNKVKQIMRETNIESEQVSFYTNADEMLEKEKLDGVLIGTRCSLHTQMAIKVLAGHIPLYLEKPIATNMNDLVALRDAYYNSNTEVVVSFPLRGTPLVQLAKEIIDSGKLGTIEHVQAVNNVAYGGVYYHHWYRDENETKGLFLQKATHDFDYINYILGIQPIRVCAMTSKQIFKGDKPEKLKCADCNEQETCKESPYYLNFHSHDRIMGEWCCFAKDVGNEDSGSAIVEYETGMHVSYSQNFFIRKKAGSRGARFMGYKGTLEFDWCTDELKVYMHHNPRTEVYKIDTEGMNHGGGDTVLAKNFIQVMKGKESSSASLESGLLSTLMCLRAKESSETKTFQEIKWPDNNKI